MTIRKRTLALTTSAGGAASGEIDFGGNSTWAKLQQLHIDYGASFDAGGDITIVDAAGKTVLTQSNSNTDFGPKLMGEAVYGSDEVAIAYDNDGNGATKPAVREPLVLGPLTVTIAQGGNAKTCTVHAWLDY